MNSRNYHSFFSPLAVVFILISSCGSADRISEPVLGGPCEGCEAVFQGKPDTIVSRTDITSDWEPGERLVLSGIVQSQNGKVASGIIVYAYQTDANGIYRPDSAYRGQAAYRHGMLRGWARTDSLGRYEFRTIRPARYPGTDIPQHIHMHILEPGCGTYYIDDVQFADDILLTSVKQAQNAQPRGGSGTGIPKKDEHGVWQITRNITLGLSIPGYPNCNPKK